MGHKNIVRKVNFETRKDLPPLEHRYLFQLRGKLIEYGYTDIIHIQDKDSDFHTHSFDLSGGHGDAVLAVIKDFLIENQLNWHVYLKD